ncbi:hypothetical protein SBA2_140003 [Acidobacteriia bacterium SbA2]|nr:hypothetical protein SBA2_140003 [Acidobacteriia bacterium SbA2]
MGAVDEDGAAPVNAVGGAADDHVADGIDEGEAGNEPHAVFGVVGNGGVGGAVIGSTFIVHGQAGKVTVGAGLAAVGGSGKADVSAAPSDGSGTAGDVIGGDDGVAPGKGVRLDFGAVVAIRVGEFVDADLLQRELGAGGQSERGHEADQRAKRAAGSRGKHYRTSTWVFVRVALGM